MSGNKFHVFVMEKGDEERQFVSAAERFVQRWGCLPTAVHARKGTKVPETAGVPVEVNDQVPANAWYFVVPEDAVDSRKAGGGV